MKKQKEIKEEIKKALEELEFPECPTEEKGIFWRWKKSGLDILVDFIMSFILIKYLSVSDFAKIKGVSRQAVIKRIKRGKLKAERVGKYYIISIYYVKR